MISFYILEMSSWSVRIRNKSVLHPSMFIFTSANTVIVLFPSIINMSPPKHTLSCILWWTMMTTPSRNLWSTYGTGVQFMEQWSMTLSLDHALRGTRLDSYSAMVTLSESSPIGPSRLGLSTLQNPTTD